MSPARMAAGTIFRALLRLYPAEFRRHVGAAMVRGFDAGLESVARGGRARGVRFAARQLADLVRNLGPEWRSPSRSGLPEPSRRHRAPLGDAARQDLRFALRSLRADPLFTGTVVAVIGTGFAFLVAVWAMVEGIVLEPLPYPEADRLVSVSESFRRSQSRSVSYLNLADWRERNTTLVDLGARTTTPLNLTGAGTADAIAGHAATPELFDLLAVQPLLGRLYTAGESDQGLALTVLSESLWRQRFGSNADIVGRDLQLDGRAFTVIGVLPHQRDFPLAGAELWIPLQVGLSERDLVNRSSHPGIEAFGRLLPGVSLEEARADLDRVGAELAAEFPDSNAEAGVRTRALLSRVVGPAGRTLGILFGAVTLTMVGLYANVASLIMARSARRSAELAVRAALGAGRSRLVRQLFAEGALLAGAGGAIGLGVAALLVRLVSRSQGLGLPRLAGLDIDVSVALFAVGCAASCSLIFSLAPVLRLDRDLPGQALRGARRSMTGDGARARSALVVAQVTLAVILLGAAGLMARTVRNLVHAETGLRPGNVLTAYLGVVEAHYPDATSRARLYRALLERVRTLPGVRRAAGGDPLPMSGRSNQWTISGDGFPQLDPGGVRVDIARVTPGYFAIMGIDLLAGRDFRESDSAADPVVIVDETLATLLWPTSNPLGQRLRFRGAIEDQPWLRVVAVARHVKNYGARDPSRYELYTPYTARVWGMSLVVETEREPLEMVGAVRAQLAALDDRMPLTRVGTMQSYLESTLATERLLGATLTAFAFAAVLVAIIGLYGSIAYSVTLRSHEFGIRRALGERDRRLLATVVGGGARLALTGAALGIVGALAAGRLLAGLLYEVPPHDPATLLAVSMVMVWIAVLATLIPARRALRVDPTVALRGD